MGNRATVIVMDNKSFGGVIHLHWNGGPESILAFYEALKKKNGHTCLAENVTARFCGIVSEYFGNGGLSLSVGDKPKSNYPREFGEYETENGVFVIDTFSDTIRQYFYPDQTIKKRTVDQSEDSPLRSRPSYKDITFFFEAQEIKEEAMKKLWESVEAGEEFNLGELVSLKEKFGEWQEYSKSLQN